MIVDSILLFIGSLLKILANFWWANIDAFVHYVDSQSDRQTD